MLTKDTVMGQGLIHKIHCPYTPDNYPDMAVVFACLQCDRLCCYCLRAEDYCDGCIEDGIILSIY